ncbi:gliding motility-associated C-terminal domain-containing protein [Eisenibacter elegans]|uniref:T9SS type B sorting domain-containing protein n=1 Tax=Eisenibacter elegans TaxID=997 RepID=UPI0009D743CF|nr:gliding motility-associated C-terminal domain-containing protein [Eisenibacter elegans]
MPSFVIQLRRVLVSTLCWLWLGFTAVFAQTACFTAAGVDNGVQRGCAPFTISVTDCSGSPATKVYKFSDAEGFVSRTTHTYTTPGRYSITQALSIGGQGDSVRRNEYIEVLPSPPPQFIATVCEGREVSLEITDRQYETYQINWGDGSPIQTVNRDAGAIRHTYPSTATFALRVTGNYVPGGCGGENAQLINPINVITQPLLEQVQVLGSNRVSLRFPTDSNFVYAVELSIDNGTTFVDLVRFAGTGFAQIYTAEALNTTQPLYFRVRAFDACGATNVSPVVATIRLQAQAQDSQNAITWPVYPLPDFGEYILLRNGNLLAIINNVNQTSYVDTAIICTERYCYSLQVNTQGVNMAESLSDTSCVRAFSSTIPPIITQGEGSVEDNRRVLLQWQVGAVPGIRRYEVIRYTTNIRNNETRIDTIIVADDRPTLLDENANFNNGFNRFCYQIRYTNVCGNTASFAPIICPVSLRIERLSGLQLSLAWTDYRNTESSLESYVVEKLDENDQVFETIPIGGLNFFIENVIDTERQITRYRIRSLVGGAAAGQMIYSNIVTVEQPFRLFFPNAFSPNGDGLNDVFAAKGLFVASYRLMIYNRAGQLVFQTTDFEQGWDGSINGREAQADLYIYTAEAEDRRGQKFQTKGTFTLIR